MNLKQCQNIFNVIANANSIELNIIKIKNGIIKHVNVNLSVIINPKKITVGILALAFVRIACI